MSKILTVLSSGSGTNRWTVVILDPDIWQSRIWRFHTGVETAGFIFLLGGQLRLLSLRSPKQPFLLGGQCVRFAYLSRFVSSRQNWAVFFSGRTAPSSLSIAIFSTWRALPFTFFKAILFFLGRLALYLQLRLSVAYLRLFLFSGRTAPSSCLRTNSVGQAEISSSKLSFREPF